MINEWNYLRVVACLCIVFLHCTVQIGKIEGVPINEYYRLMQVLLCFATPTFVILSEIILSNRYPEKLPPFFWKKRFKWIFIPFLMFGIIDYLVRSNFSIDSNSYKAILYKWSGRYEGWFVLIIMQFYFLHHIVIKYKISAKLLLIFGIIIMIMYLNILNTDILFIKNNKQHLKLAFTAWLGYFTFAYIVGKYYSKIQNYLFTYRWITLLGVILSVLIVYINFKSGSISPNSRRIDLIPLTITVSLAVIAWTQNLPRFQIIDLISRYSFAIYLIHWQVQYYITPYFVKFTDNTILQVLTLFISTLLLSCLIIFILAKLPLSQFLIGKIKNSLPNKNLNKVTLASMRT